jgi:phosphatidylglycerophosphatase A
LLLRSKESLAATDFSAKPVRTDWLSEEPGRQNVAIKESSDELNPAVPVAKSSIESARISWNAVDYLALAIATWGVGYLPLMPGTFGSLVGVGLFLALAQVSSSSSLVLLVIVSILAITLAGIWAAFRTEELEGRKDPGKVVVDEVAGQLIALLPLTFFTLSPSAVIISFILFRLFDIVKPYPAGRLEHLRGGFGIMCDDLVAGAYAAIITSVIAVIR